eukprot:6183064-Pleurochrysis_carterae.AAC.5
MNFLLLSSAITVGVYVPVTPQPFYQQPFLSRASHLTACATHAECGVLVLQSDNTDGVAKVLSAAWTEAGMKRGLEGAVCCSSKQEVQIFARGPLPRLQSFASWCARTLNVNSVPLQLESCPTVSLSRKFPLVTDSDLVEELEATVITETPEEAEYILRHLPIQAKMLRALEYSCEQASLRSRLIRSLVSCSSSPLAAACRPAQCLNATLRTGSQAGREIRILVKGDKAGQVRSLERWMRRGGPPMARVKRWQFAHKSVGDSTAAFWKAKVSAIRGTKDTDREPDEGV